MFVSHEASLIACGFGYRARQEKKPEEFNTVRSMDIKRFSFSSSCKESIAGWNMRTQHWLKYYCMVRQMDRTQSKKIPQVWPKIAAFTMSSMFHGYYIGYTVFFGALFFIDEAWAAISRSYLIQQGKMMLPETLRIILSTVICQVLLRFSCVNFFLLTFEDCLTYCTHYFHYIFTIPLILLVVGKLTTAKQEARPKQTKFVYSEETTTSASDGPQVPEKAKE